MNRPFNILFAVETSSHDDCSYVQRLRVLKRGLEKLGVSTGWVYLSDYPIGSPRILLPVNTPLFLKLARKYDFIHCCGLSVFSVAPAKPFANFKTICDVQGSIEENFLNRKRLLDLNFYYHLFSQSIASHLLEKIADYFVAVSEPLRQKLLRKGVRREKTELLYNAVDTQLFRPANKKSNDRFTVTYAGGYQGWQGIDNFVDAIKLLEKTDIKFKLMGFQERDKLAKERVKAKLGMRAELIDFKPRTQNLQPFSFIEEIASSDLLIIPRYTNPSNQIYSNPEYVRRNFGWLPTKFGEYIATGRPIIVTDLDVASDFVKQYDCGFVSAPDPKSLANTILDARHTSSEELNIKGKNGRKLAQEQFDIEVVAKRYFNILSALSA